MQIKRGWSGETETNVWRKVDIVLDESDLNRLLRENDLPDELAERLPVKVCEALLHNEAETLVLMRLTRFGLPQDEANAQIARLITATRAIVAEIKEKLALV
jgi:hypothetical protein